VRNRLDTSMTKAAFVAAGIAMRRTSATKTTKTP
jgi:hypothetical protein